jgi:hypothetical protein
MKRTLAIAAVAAALLIAAMPSFAQDFAAIDALHETKRLDEELAALKRLYAPQDPQAAVTFRLMRCLQQLAVEVPSKQRKEKLAAFDEAMAFGKQVSESSKGEALDRAKLVYWYAATVAQKGQTQGVLNSLFMVPQVRELCDKSIAIDPDYGDPYYLKALLDDAVPDVAGGDKARMGVLFAKGLSLDPTNLWYITDFAKALKKRNRDASYNKDGSKGVPVGSSDLEYAKKLAKNAEQVLSGLDSPTVYQKGKVDEMHAAGL